MARSVDVELAPPFAAEALRGAHVAVVDVLRATTTIATALANGAEGIVPAADAEDALAVARRLGRERVLLCGERESVLIPGFDLDNSPASYTAETVAGKLLVLTTTNGTRALRAAAGAASVRTAAFVNRAAVAAALAAEDGPMAILCAGVQGGFALEDALGAGALVDALLARDPELDVRDGARAAALLYRDVRGRLAEAVASADHASELVAKGFAADLGRCSALDALDVVPTLRHGMLVAREPSAGRPEPVEEPSAVDAATLVARRLEADLSGFRERHGREYAVRDGVNATLLAGALQGYVAIAFRERRAEEVLRAIGDAFEDALQSQAPGARDLAEGFLDAAAEWPAASREALRAALGARGRALHAAMRPSASSEQAAPRAG